MNEMQKAAEDYLVERGWHPVQLEPAIPGKAESGKRPLGKWRDREWTIESLRIAFQGRINIGLDCGKSGLVIVDCDSSGAKEYAKSVCKETGYVVETGGGGLHLYYTSPPSKSVRNRQKIDGHAVDLRASGGYAVAPPSEHYTGGLYRIVENGELTEFDPSWFPQSEPHFPKIPCVDFDRRRIRKYVSKIHSVSGQGGDTAAFKVACFLVKNCRTVDEAWDELLIWNDLFAFPPWSESRLKYKLNEAAKLKSLG